MAKPSDFSATLMAQLAIALAKEGVEPNDIDVLCARKNVLRAIPQLARDEAGVVMKPRLLTFIFRQNVIAQPTITTSVEYFKEAGVSFIGDNFRNQFLDLEVGAIEDTTLSICGLNRESLNVHILQELGDKAETTPSQFRNFLSVQMGSHEQFVFYMKGKGGKLWAVCAGWGSRRFGWGVNAYSVDGSSGWPTGHQVVSQLNILNSAIGR